MRILQIVLATLLLGALAFPLVGCGSETGAAEETENEVVTVQRGNLTIDITAVGNLALSRTEDLAFDIFYPEATVEEVLVEEGDTVKEGQELAKLDISEWDEELETLEDLVTTAKRLLTAAERQLTAKQRDLIQAEINLSNARIALEDAEAYYVWPEDVFAARQAVWNAESELEDAQRMLGAERLVEVYDRQTGNTYVYYEQATTLWDIKVWTQRLFDAEEDLRAAQVNLDELLAASAADAKVADAEEKLWAAQVNLDKLLAASTADTAAERAERNEEIAIQTVQVELAQQRLEDAQQAQEGVVIKRLEAEVYEIRLEEAEKAIEDAEIAIEDARKVVEDAQEDLDEAKDKSPIVTAPFDGFITSVNVEGGDEVLNGTVAVQLADPLRFEADLLVSEMDIFQVKLGGDATVEMDAMPSVTFSAKVTHISPTATIEAGVVNYEVKVELESLTPLEPSAVSGGQGQTQTALESFYQKLDEAVKEGSITQEQAEQMKEGVAKLDEAVEEGKITQEQAKQIRERLGLVPETEQKPQGTTPEHFQLREGLTVTVSIIVDERKDVLLVPNKAITHQEDGTYVQISEDGVTESRLIETGISDWQHTEVTEGLREGEKVVIGQVTTAAPTTP